MTRTEALRDLLRLATSGPSMLLTEPHRQALAWAVAASADDDVRRREADGTARLGPTRGRE